MRCLVLSSYSDLVLTSSIHRDDDALTALFNGAVATSSLIGLSSAGSAICASFLERPKIYLISSFFLNIYPQMAAISCLFALTQRQSLRRKMSSANSGQNKGPGGEGGEAELLRMARKTGKTVDNPGLWRGDKISLGPHIATSASRSFPRLSVAC